MMRCFIFCAALTLSVSALGQTVCNLPATGPQPYSVVPGGTGAPVHVPGGLDETLGYIPQPYVALPGEPAVALAFCGPAWQANYAYQVGNMIQLENGTVMLAVRCVGGCMSGATTPAGFSGALFEPSPIILWAGQCSDSGSTATCETVSAPGLTAPVNIGEPYPGADVGATMVILNYAPNPKYTGVWTVTSSTGIAPFTFSFAGSSLGSGDCNAQSGGTSECVSYQRGSQVVDNQVTWQDVGPQNETAGFIIKGTAVTVSPGATTGNTSTVSVTPSGGFTGNVTLTAAVNSSPAGAVDLPTFSFGSTSPVDITGSATGSATLTISTTAPAAASTKPGRPGDLWYRGGTGLAVFALLFGVVLPARRRDWRARAGILGFVVILIGGLLACGGTSGGGGGGGGSGTTAGSYTVTVTGTSGGVRTTGTVSLTVQ